MNGRNVTIIPATKPDQPNKYLGTPGKIHVVGYAKVIKGTGAGVQIYDALHTVAGDESEFTSYEACLSPPQRSRASNSGLGKCAGYLQR